MHETHWVLVLWFRYLSCVSYYTSQTPQKRPKCYYREHCGYSMVQSCPPWITSTPSQIYGLLRGPVAIAIALLRFTSPEAVTEPMLLS